jgi:hypothetical protein
MVFSQGSSHIALRTKVLGSIGGFWGFCTKNIESQRIGAGLGMLMYVITRQCDERVFTSDFFPSVVFPRSMVIALATL